MLRKEYLIKAYKDKLKITEEKAKEAFFAMEDILFEEMFSCAKVKLYGIGTITKVIRKARTYTMPDGSKVDVPSKPSLKIKPTKEMSFQLNKKNINRKDEKYFI